jgi:disulfide bond formation protein DsbB
MFFKSVVSRILSPKMQLKVYQTVSRFWWVGVCAVGFLAWASAEMLEVFGNFPACRLCHIERFIFLTVGVLAFLYLVAKKWVHFVKPVTTCILSWAVIAASALGFLISLYHSAIQFHLVALPSFCTLPKTGTFEQFMALPSATCDQWTLSFLFLPMPVYLVFLFLFIAGLTWHFSRTKTSSFPH